MLDRTYLYKIILLVLWYQIVSFSIVLYHRARTVGITGGKGRGILFPDKNCQMISRRRPLNLSLSASMRKKYNWIKIVLFVSSSTSNFLEMTFLTSCRRFFPTQSLTTTGDSSNEPKVLGKSYSTLKDLLISLYKPISCNRVTLFSWRLRFHDADDSVMSIEGSEFT